MTGLLVQRVEPLSVAYDGGIERGSIILEINRQPVNSIAGFRRIVGAARPGDVLAVYLYEPELDQRAHPHRPHGVAVKPRILVIDDEAAIRDSLKMTLEYDGYDVMLAATGEEGVKLVEREAPDLVFLDIKMPGMDGLEVLQKLRHLVEVTPIVVISGHADITTAVEATKLGAFDFIEKPLERERVLVTVRNAVDTRRLKTENKTLPPRRREEIPDRRRLAVAGRGARARSRRRRRPTPPC